METAILTDRRCQTQQDLGIYTPIGSEVERIISAAPEMEDLGLGFMSPAERRDRGAIEYTTVPETIQHWAEDPQGIRTLEFIGDAYGIPQDRIVPVLESAGMGEYLKNKAEGRFMGMVSTQVEKPTMYFMTNVIALGEVARQGIPTALMMLEYPDDEFFTGNSDKRLGFGKIEFPVAEGVKTKRDGTEVVDEHGQPVTEVRSVSIELKPYGIRHEDGSVTRIETLDEANGYKCSQVLVQAIDSRGPDKQQYAVSGDATAAREDTTQQVFVKGALGIDIPGLPDGTEPERAEAISLTDFYKKMWIQTIDRLRESGVIPSEEDMPMFFVDALQLYSTLAREANPSEEVKKMLGYDSREAVLSTVLQIPNQEEVARISADDEQYQAELQKRNLTQLENGLLVHPNGMMDPGSYYAAQTVWPDLYFECSSCGGDYFVGKIQRGQQVQDYFGVPHKEVRLPDAEVPALERYALHPTGRFFDAKMTVDPKRLELDQHIRDAVRQGRKNGLTKEEIAQQTQPIEAELTALKAAARTDYQTRLTDTTGPDYIQTGLVIPREVAAVYKRLLSGLKTAARSSQVQSAAARMNRFNWDKLKERYGNAAK